MDTIYPGRNIIYLDEQPESGFISTLWQWTFSATPTPTLVRTFGKRSTLEKAAYFYVRWTSTLFKRIENLLRTFIADSRMPSSLSTTNGRLCWPKSNTMMTGAEPLSTLEKLSLCSLLE